MSQASERRDDAGHVAVTINAFDPYAADTRGYESYALKAKPRRMGFGPHVIISKILSYVLAPILRPLAKKVRCRVAPWGESRPVSTLESFESRRDHHESRGRTRGTPDFNSADGRKNEERRDDLSLKLCPRDEQCILSADPASGDPEGEAR